MMNIKHILSRGHRAVRVSTNACGKTGFAMRFIISLLLLVTTGVSSTWAQRVAPTIETSYSQEGHWHYLRFSHNGRYAKSNGVGNVITIPTSKATDGSCWWQFVGDDNDFVIVDFSGNYITWANPYKLTSDKNQAAHFVLDPHTGDANAWELKNKGLTGQVWMNPRPSNNNIQHWNDNDNGNKLIFDAVTDQEIWELNYTGPKWYTMKPNNGGYISSDYATAEGRMHVANSNAKPTNYAGIWRFYDVPGVDGQNLINAKYYATRVLSVVGTDGTAVAKMDPASTVRSGSRYKFEIASNGFVQVQGENLYLGNNSMQLCVRTTTGDGSLNLNLTRVPNLGNAVTIKCIDSNENEITDATIAYSCKREDISSKTVILKHNDVYDFKDVPYMEYIFTDSPTCEIISTSYDEIHATLTFVVRKVESTEWTFNIMEGYTVNYNGFLDINNGEKAVLPVNINRMFLSVNGTEDKFVWGPIIDDKAKTVTYEVRDLATELPSGWYQLQIADNEVAALSDQIIPKAGNINTKANTLYLAPAIYLQGETSKILKATGVPQYAGEASTFVYIKDNGNGTYSLTSSVSGQSITGSFTFNNGVLTKSGNWSYESTAQPLEGPFLLPSGSGSPSFKVAKADISGYTIYKVSIKEGEADASNVRLDIKNPHVLGSTAVSDGGYLFMQQNSTVPLVSQVNVIAGNVTVANITTGVETDGVKPITFHVATKQDMWKAVITGNAANPADYIIYDGNNYENGESMPLAEGYEPKALDFKTNVTNRFVWGPIIDKNAKTVTFEIKTPVNVSAGSGTPLNESGWYQFQLVPYSNGETFINDINSRSTGAKSRKGSYIYLFNANTEFQQNASNYYPVKFAAVPENGDQGTSFLYVTANGQNPRFQAINGHYIKDNGCMSTSPANMQKMEAIAAENIYGVYRWSRYDTGSEEAPYMGASGTGRNFFVRAVKVDPTTLYDVYKIDLSGTSQNKVRYIGSDNHGISELYNNGYLFLTKDADAPTKDDFYFDGTTRIESINISDQKVITFSVSSRADGYSNTIIHRQHDVYDRIALASDNLLPKGSHIKRGEGMIDHPMKDGFTSDNTDNDRRIQNTSVFHVTQYTKPGTSTECILPFTKNKGTGDHVKQYQRWYDYQTERPLANGILTLSNFYQFTNGYCNYNSSGSRLRDAIGSANITLPAGYKELYVGVDASEFSDSRAVSGNFIEPSLNMRVIYHIINAHEMAKKLTTSGEDWWEEKEYFVPNIKRGSDTYKNNADIIPLDMPFSNYWIYKTEGNTTDANLMPIVAENGSYSTLKSNLEIKVEGSAASYIDVGVFDGNPGNIGSAPYINGNHFLYYKVKGTGETRIVPAGSQAVIKVYAKDGSNGSSPKYQLFKFTLNFQSATEPLAITSVVGNSASTRSVDYFIKNGFKESASLTFQNKDVAFTRIPGHRNDGNEGVTYAFPIDFSRTSYGYSPSNTFGNYRITTKGYGIQYRPVSLYEHNIKNRTNTTMKCDDDYFFYIDAAESPGQVASITLDGTLCVGSRLYCYGWVGSANRYNEGAAGASVLLQVVGRRHNGTEQVIASYLPGTLTDVSYDEEGDAMRSLSYAGFPSQQTAGWMNLDATQVGVWNSVGFSFVVNDVTFDSYDLRIINNCFSTAGGDYVLDDFRVFVSPPKGNVDFTTPLCSDALRHVKIHTDFDMLLEVSGANNEIANNQIPVSFCFLNKKIYDEGTKDYYDVDEFGNRTLKSGIDYDSDAVKSVFNQAFGDALIGVRSINKNVKGHAFHNFTVPVDFNAIPTYAYNESPDDQIFKEEKSNGERRIVFKEQLYQSDGAAHNWKAGESYYLLFSPFHVEEGHVTSHEVGTSTFDIASLCCVLTTFDIMPPIEVKGDATVTSSDQVKACDNQIVTFKVDMPALKLDEEGTGVSDAVISGLNYDWWVGESKEEATYAGFYGAKYGTYTNIADARRYNHQAVDDYPDDSDVKMDVYLKSALENIRFYFPEARTLDEVTLKSYDNGNGYGIVKEHLDCVRHFITPLDNGRKPLSLFGQTFNLKVSHAEADANSKQHFVAIPIIPKQDYGVYEKLIYCPAPQELIVHVADQAPNLQNGFGNMTYPDYIVNVPVRIGKQQIENVRKVAEADLVGNTLSIPLRKIQVVDGSSTKLMAKDHETERFGSIYLTATDDNYYSFDTDGGEFTMRRVAQVIDIEANKGAQEGYMKIAFTSDFPVREGYTYTLKLPYIEDVACMCEGTLVFDIKVVPEYQVWTGRTKNSDWTNDSNWARADRDELLAANGTATGDGMTGATSLNDETSYETNEKNTTASSFVPMYFTNVLINQNDSAMVELYKDGFIAPDRSQNQFLAGMKSTATKDIVYDLSVKPVSVTDRNYTYAYDCDYDCELFDTYIANGVTFTPGAQMGNTHYLKYNKAWVEYELKADRWYTLGSPLKKSVAGDWYSPTAGGKQMTPHFYEINYKPELNDRFRPAYYQRSWDRDGNNVVYEKNNDTYNSYVRADWSYVYNDAAVDYSAGGFSVKAELDYMNDGVRTDAVRPANDSVLVRMPKADTSYKYFAVDGSTGQAADAQIVASPNTSRADIGSYRLMSDDLGATGSGTIQMTVANKTTDNNFLLLHNPFMAAMDMDAFFAENTDLEKKYWIVEADKQMVSVKSAADGQWISNITDGASGQYVAPLQGFFVKKKDNGSAPQNAITAIYRANMQTVVLPDKELNVPTLRTRATDTGVDLIRLIAERNGASSTAIIMLGENFSDGYMDGEDCETFVDGNLYDKPTVYTSAGMMAQTINVRKSLEMVPVGVISSDDSEVVLHFDLSRCSHNTIYLYDDESGSFTEIYDGAKIVMSGNTAGRYYLASSMGLEKLDSMDNDSSKGIWTPSGVYCGESIDGLTPGLYIVNGVKMLIRSK